MFAYGFEEAQIAGLQPSLLANKLRLYPKTLSLMFMKIQIQPNGCWMWMGCRRAGYGAIRIRALSAQVLVTHRVTYQLVHGPIDPALDLHHLTENGCMGPSCCNPDHLMPVTKAVHVRDLTPGSISYVNARKESCPAGHPFDEKNTLITRAGVRHCKACDRIRAQARRDRLRTRPKFAKDPEKLKTKCFRDHDMTDESNVKWVDSPTGKQRQCRACEAIRVAAYKVGKKADSLPKDQCKRGHPMVGDNVYLHPDGVRRTCMACRKLNFYKQPGDPEKEFDIADFSLDDDQWM